MTKRPYKPENLPGMMPYLGVANPEASIEFYRKTFGFELVEEPMKQEGKIVHAEMKYLDTRFMLGPVTGFGGSRQTPKQSGIASSWNQYVYTTDVDALFRRVKECGAVIGKELSTEFYGDRNFMVMDLDGYFWMFGQNVADFDPSKMPC